MWYSYFLIAFRNLLKHKVFSFVNILGLAIGVSVCLLLLNFIQFQRSYDEFHVRGNRIYRVPMSVQEKGGVLQTFAFTYPAVGPHLKKDYPEVEDMTRLRFYGGLAKRGTVAERVQCCYADPAFFRIFSFKMLEGDPATVFAQPYSAVLTQKMAGLLFQQENPVGKSFTMNDREWTVRGLLEDPPVNSHLRLGMLLDYPTYVQMEKADGGDAEGSWGWSDFYTYVLLRQDADPAALAAKFPDFTRRYMNDDMQKNGFEQHFFLQPLRDIHLRSQYDYELEGNGNFKFIYVLGAAALVILLIAWLNYVNLATARALDRAREVGVRKVNGAGPRHLIMQFLTESLLVNALAVCIGLVLFVLALSTFARIVDRAPIDLLPHGGAFWAALAALFGLGALISGFYPAWLLSRFNPIFSLKNVLTKGWTGGKARLRKTMVVTQFSIAILMVTGALALFWQLRFMQKQSLGFDKEHMLVLEESVSRDSVQQATVRAFLSEVGQLSGVQSTTCSTSVPGGEVGNSSDFKNADNGQMKRCRTFGIDEHFIAQYGLDLVAGRAFSAPFETDRRICILNETAVRVLGFKSAEEAVGRQVMGGSGRLRTVVGVLRDYHQESLRHAFNPTLFYPNDSDWGYYSIKYESIQSADLVDRVGQLWKKHFPGTPFQHYFLDTYYDRQYRLDQMFGAVLLACTALTLLVACLGLLGLSLFTVSKRQKELGVRKVLGATAGQLIAMISREYLLLIAVAAVLTLPLAVFGVQKLLSTYAFHTQLGWWFYLMPAALLALVAFLTTLGQSWRAALNNPARALRSE